MAWRSNSRKSQYGLAWAPHLSATTVPNLQANMRGHSCWQLLSVMGTPCPDLLSGRTGCVSSPRSWRASSRRGRRARRSAGRCPCRRPRRGSSTRPPPGAASATGRSRHWKLFCLWHHFLPWNSSSHASGLLLEVSTLSQYNGYLYREGRQVGDYILLTFIPVCLHNSALGICNWQGQLSNLVEK